MTGSPQTILLIEDDVQIRQFMRQVLELSGYEVIEAQDGLEGVRKAQETSVDLVITDLFMPEKSGVEVIIEILDKKPDTKCIAISGLPPGTRDNYMNTAYLMGASRLLVKPFTSDQLITTVRELIPGGGSDFTQGTSGL